MKKIMMIAGEPSGDLHGSNLATELKKIMPRLEIFGTGGERMKNAGVNILFDLKALAMTGLLDVIKNYFRLKKIQTALLDKIKKEKPDLIILIDYPDFNLRFAKKVGRDGPPIIYYISPQIWAWRRHRIKLIKKYIKKIIVIFKFEEELYKKKGVPVEFVGHPLLDIVKPSVSREEFLKRFGIDANKKIIGLFPGSRTGLVKTHLPIILKSAEVIHKNFPEIKFLLSKSQTVDRKIYEDALKKINLPVMLIKDGAYDIISASDFVLAISGTITLETAILEKPMAIIYKLPLLEYILARPLLRLKNIGLVNIVAGRQIVPEFIQFKARPKIIADALLEILRNKQKCDEIKNNLAAVKTSLYPSGASQKAAESILSILNRLQF